MSDAPPQRNRHDWESPKPGADEVQVNWIEPGERALLWSADARRTSPVHRVAVRAGFASIFAVNGIVGLVHPQDFTQVLADNVLASQLGLTTQQTLVTMAALNDLLLAAALLVSTRSRSSALSASVYAWMATWLSVVAATKAMNLLW